MLNPLCFFLGCGGYAEGYGRPRRLHRLRLRRGNYCGVLLRGGYATLLHKQPTWKVCSQKKAAQDAFVEGFRIQQFLKFRFFQRHQCWVEAAKHFATECRAGGALKLEKLTLRKSPSCQRLHRNWRFRDRIFWWKTPCGQCIWNRYGTRNERSPPVWPTFVCVTSCNYLPRWSIWPVGSFGIYRPWKRQTQTQELCHLLASNSEIGICVAPSIERSLDSNTQTSSFWSFVVPKAPMLKLKLRSTLQQNAGLVVF